MPAVVDVDVFQMFAVGATEIFSLFMNRSTAVPCQKLILFLERLYQFCS
jgi:hypothetical protein